MGTRFCTHNTWKRLTDFNTRMMRSIEEGMAPGQSEQALEQFSNAIPMKRYGEPGEIADLLEFSNLPKL